MLHLTQKNQMVSDGTSNTKIDNLAGGQFTGTVEDVKYLRDKLFSCMSSRAAANIMDEMEALGPVRLAEVQEAQKQIIAVARRLSDEGTIVLAGRGGDDFV